MLDFIYDVKNNKRRVTALGGGGQAATAGKDGDAHNDGNDWMMEPLKKYLSALRKMTAATGDLPPQLRLSWNDLMNSSTVGRWWLVGSAWKGKQHGVPDTSSSSSSSSNNSRGLLARTTKKGRGDDDDDSKAAVDDEEDDTGMANLMALAAKQGMNTDVRKSIFCIIMGAQDYMDAFEKLCKMNPKGKQDKEVVRVLIRCCEAVRPFPCLVLIFYDSHCTLTDCGGYRKPHITLIIVWYSLDYVGMLVICDSVCKWLSGISSKPYYHLLVENHHRHVSVLMLPI
jgi:hypothetical protein